METRRNISFLQVIENSLVRKNIFKKISSFYDIANLAKTCRLAKYFIQVQAIRKDMLCFRDVHVIDIKVKKEFLQYLNEPKYEDIEFKHYVKYFDEDINKNYFFGEEILKKNSIYFSCYNNIQDFSEEERELLFRKLEEKMNLSCHIRRDATTLDFLIYTSSNSYMILYMLSFIKNDNITCITIPIISFIFNANNYRKLKCGIFEGFSRLNELEFDALHGLNDMVNRRFMENKNVIEHVLNDFSRKENATLVLKNLKGFYGPIVEYVKIILEIVSKLKIKVKCDIDEFFSILDEENNSTCSNKYCIHFPIKEYTTSIKYTIKNSRKFFNIMKNLQCFRYLETLILNFSFFDIKKGFEKRCELNCKSFSLKHFDKLKVLKLNFTSYSSKKNYLKVEMFYKNLKYLSSCMPRSVERLELFDGFDLTKNVMESVSKCMPNIKLLAMYNISFKDSNCLVVFKNLQTLISFNYCPIEIPTTVKLLIIENWKCDYDDKITRMNQKIIMTYFEKFLKSLQNTKGGYVFFNDINEWDKFKCIIQEFYYKKN